MPKYLTTNKDPEGKSVRVECAFKSADGKVYLLLRRMPPLYSLPPLWVVEMSGETVVQREPGGSSTAYPKLVSIQDFSDSEKEYLLATAAGKMQLPFFNFSYPNVIRVLGKRFYKLNDHEIGPLLEGKLFALVRPRL